MKCFESVIWIRLSWKCNDSILRALQWRRPLAGPSLASIGSLENGLRAPCLPIKVFLVFFTIFHHACCRNDDKSDYCTALALQQAHKMSLALWSARTVNNHMVKSFLYPPKLQRECEKFTGEKSFHVYSLTSYKVSYVCLARRLNWCHRPGRGRSARLRSRLRP